MAGSAVVDGRLSVALMAGQSGRSRFREDEFLLGAEGEAVFSGSESRTRTAGHLPEKLSACSVDLRGIRAGV